MFEQIKFECKDVLHKCLGSYYYNLIFWCRPVKIIRLVSQHSVEEIILNRALAKMKLTNAVIAEGQVRQKWENGEDYI